MLFFSLLAFEAIHNFKTEILLAPKDIVMSDELEDLVQRRRDTLVSILSTAKPLHGKGYFIVDNTIITAIVSAATTYIVVLVQFNMSETPLQTNETNSSIDVKN